MDIPSNPDVAPYPKSGIAMDDVAQGQDGSEKLQKHWQYAVILYIYGLGF